jgi:hypothetical protein
MPFEAGRAAKCAILRTINIYSINLNIIFSASVFIKADGTWTCAVPCQKQEGLSSRKFIYRKTYRVRNLADAHDVDGDHVGLFAFRQAQERGMAFEDDKAVAIRAFDEDTTPFVGHDLGLLDSHVSLAGGTRLLERIHENSMGSGFAWGRFCSSWLMTLSTLMSSFDGGANSEA